MEEKLVTDSLFQEKLEALSDRFPEADEINYPVDVVDKAADEVPPSDEIQPDQPPETQFDEAIVKNETQKELTEVEKLINKRTGFWQVHLKDHDLKWIKNSCQGKFEYEGANEAFMLVNCYIGFSAAVARLEQEVKVNSERSVPVLQASSIESCAFFINKHKGAGIESAQRCVRIAMALNPIIMEMRKLDDAIESIKKAEEAAKNKQQGILSQGLGIPSPNETEQPIPTE